MKVFLVSLSILLLGFSRPGVAAPLVFDFTDVEVWNVATYSQDGFNFSNFGPEGITISPFSGTDKLSAPQRPGIIQHAVWLCITSLESAFASWKCAAVL